MVALKQMPVETPRRVTAREYLERERTAETKREFHRGVIVAMAEASPEHNTITVNVLGELYSQLRGKECRPFASDMRVRVPACDNYYYPDVVVVCGEPRYQVIAGIQSLLNPTLIVEVLSESTATMDRGEKWECYQTLESLQTYVLVAQERAFVEVYERGERNWSYTSTADYEQTITLDAIQCNLRLSDVYARVPLQPALPRSAATDMEPTPEDRAK